MKGRRILGYDNFGAQGKCDYCNFDYRVIDKVTLHTHRSQLKMTTGKSCQSKVISCGQIMIDKD